MKNSRLLTLCLCSMKKIQSVTFGQMLASLTVSQIIMFLVFVFTRCFLEYRISLWMIEGLSVVCAIILIIREQE